jgi:hypothetical protein
MIEAEKREFAEVLKATLDIYGKEVSVSVLGIWWNALVNYSIQEVRQGFTHFIRSADYGNFPPKPADIIKMIDGTGADRSLLAWTKVLQACGSVGAYRSVAFDDPIIHLVVEDMGGWIKMCGSESDQLDFMRNDFSKRYRDYVVRGLTDSYPKYLIGISEGDNKSRGYKIAPPMLVGDPQKCQLVLTNGGDNSRVRITSASEYAAQAVLSIHESKERNDG